MIKNFIKLGLTIDKRNRIKTNNAMGFMFLGQNKVRAAIADFAKPGCRVADVGCAFGLDTMTLTRGGAEVLAMDMDQSHLDAIKQGLAPEEFSRVTLVCDRFPSVSNLLPEASFDAVLLLRVLIFLRPEELETAFGQAYTALKPGGTVFVVNASPFSDRWTKVRERFELRHKIDPSSPFFVTDLWDVLPPLKAYFPPQILLFDEVSLKSCLQKSGFTILESGYMEDEGTVDAYAIAKKQ